MGAFVGYWGHGGVYLIKEQPLPALSTTEK